MSVVYQQAKPRVTLDTLHVRPGSDASVRASVLHEWHKSLLHDVLPASIDKWQVKMQVKVAGYFLQRMKTKWGSCNHQAGHIRLNTELVKKPRDLLEYVVVHEMAHLREPTHNDRRRSFGIWHRVSFEQTRSHRRRIATRNRKSAQAVNQTRYSCQMTEIYLEHNKNRALVELAQKRVNARALGKMAPGLGSLSYLLNLYEENFDLLTKLLGSVRNYSGAHLSHVPGKPPLWLEIIEQQPYTSILRITHSFGATRGVVLDPNAYVRVYHDTKQAETTHCFVGAELKKLYSLDVPLREVNEKRLQMTTFFNKWLHYLLETGHSPSSFGAVDAMPSAPASPILAPERIVR